MKILEISFENPFKAKAGGVESYIISLSNFLKVSGNNVTIIYNTKDNILTKNENIIEIHVNNIFRKFVYNIKLYVYIKKHKKEYDIIHINGDNGYFIPFIKNIKTVMTLHGSMLEYSTKNIRNLKFRSIIFNIIGILDGYMEIIACRKSKKVIAVSDHIKEYFSKRANRNDIKYIPPCINMENDVDISELNLKDLDNIIRDKIVCLWVGLDPIRKGLEIAKKAVGNFDNTILITAGYKDNNNTKNVINLGYVDKNLLLYLYKISDIFIFPSKYEGFGIVLIEAMSFGLVPICFKMPTAEELIKNGENGFLVTDNREFKKKIEDLIKNKERMKTMKENSLRRSKDFYCSKVLPKIETIFKDLLNS